MQDYFCFEMRRFTQSVTMTDPFQITVLFATLTFTQQDHWLRSETFFISKPLIMIRLLGCVTHVDAVCFYVKKKKTLCILVYVPKVYPCILIGKQHMRLYYHSVQ